MPKKVRPRWGWEPTLNVADEKARRDKIDDDKIAEIIGRIDPNSDPRFDNGLIAILGRFYFEAFELPDPNWDEMRAALAELGATAESLIQRIRGLDWRTRSWLHGSFERMADNASDEIERDEINQCAEMILIEPKSALKMLGVLSKAIDSADIPFEPLPKGRRPNIALQNFIYSLSEFYGLHSGLAPLHDFYRNAIEDRYEGQLVKLAEYILGRYAPDLNITNASIGEYIRRVIGDRSKSKR